MSGSNHRNKKSHLNGSNQKKPPEWQDEKATSMEGRKATSYYIPKVLLGTKDEIELKKLLKSKKQTEWASPKRIGGLMMLINHFALKGKVTAMSSELSRQYVSHLKRAKKPTTIKQPLALLVHIGILEIVQHAIIAPHRKASAKYQLKGKPRKITAHLTKAQLSSLDDAPKRQEARLNRKHKTRKKLLHDLSLVGLSSKGRDMALDMMATGTKAANIKQLIEAIKGNQQHMVSYDPSGTIRNFVMRCPKELKKHLTLDNRPVEIIDMKAAHLCILPCVAQSRIDWRKGKGQQADAIKAERKHLMAILEDGDIYDYLREGCDRDKFKKALLTSLNMTTKTAYCVDAYQKMRGVFPEITGIIEDLKKNDHRGLSKQLQHYTAQIIEGAMLEAKERSMPCIPDTDALIVQKRHRDEARAFLNSSVEAVTGLKL